LKISSRFNHPLYHFTCKRNLVSIKASGGLYATAKLREMGIKNFYPAGNDLSLDLDKQLGMDTYVHLCFRTNHPLEYRASQDGRILRTTWLTIDPSIIDLEGVMYCAGVANRVQNEYIPIHDALEMIDSEVLYGKTDWHDPEILDRLKAAEKCEILVPDVVPFKYFERHFPNG